MAPRPTVYIETTIPSFYVEIREEPVMVARRQWTREWWDTHRGAYDVVTSEAVLDELLGFHVPALVTPLELLGEIEDER